jgi:hypothetical protein
VDLRRQPVEDVLERVEEAVHARLDRQAVVRKRRSVGGRTERGTWVRIERRGFERIGPQGWNGTEAAAVLQGVAMPEWYQGVAWREPGEPVMWRADELELIPSPSVGKGALVLEDPGLPDEWWQALTRRFFGCATLCSTADEAGGSRCHGDDRAAQSRPACRGWCRGEGRREWPTGRAIRRYECDRPGELVHLGITATSAWPT